MAMKDWNKISEEYYENNKNNNALWIEYGDVGRGKKWFVFLDIINKDSLTQLSPNSGLTKPQAISFAKSYMRSH